MHHLEPGVVGAQPQALPFGLERQRIDGGADESAFLGRAGPVDQEPVPVETVQPFLGGDPQKALVVELQRVDGSLRQAPVRPVGVQAQPGRPGIRRSDVAITGRRMQRQPEQQRGDHATARAAHGTNAAPHQDGRPRAGQFPAPCAAPGSLKDRRQDSGFAMRDGRDQGRTQPSIPLRSECRSGFSRDRP